MNRNLPAHEKIRRKFYKFVCREGLYYPAVKLEDFVIYDDELNPLAKTATLENFEYSNLFMRDGRKMRKISGYFRVEITGDLIGYTEYKSGIASYHHRSSAYHLFWELTLEGRKAGKKKVAEKEMLKSFERWKAREKRLMSIWRRMKAQIRFADQIYEYAKSVSPWGLWYPSFLWDELMIYEKKIFSMSVKEDAEKVGESIIQLAYLVQIANISQLLNSKNFQKQTKKQQNQRP